MRRSERKKMNLPLKIFLWMFGILVLLAIIAVIYVAAKIFITGDKIHNPLDRSHSALRSKNVNLSKGEPLRLRYLVLILMPKENKQMMDKEVIPS